MDRDYALQSWQAIYEHSLQMLTPPDSRVWIDGVYLDSRGKASWSGIRDLRTLHMGGGRQNFKSAWAGEFLNRHPQAICIENNKDMRDAFISNCGGRHTFFHRVFTIKDIMSIVKENPAWITEVLSKTTHVIFNDGSFNTSLHTPAFRQLMDGLFGPDITVVMLG